MSKRSKTDEGLVKQLVELIMGGNAHADFDKAVEGLSIETISRKPQKLPYSIWQLVEHIRIAQWDILEFSRNPKHQSPKWPDAYWPEETAPPHEQAWKDSLEQIRKDRDDFITLLHDDDVDLYAPFPYGEGQNLLREALLVADHASYHIGEIIVIRRLLDDWKS